MVSVSQVLAVSAVGVVVAGIASTDAGWGYRTNACSAFTNANWGDIKYTCSWEHKDVRVAQYHNIFIMHNNGAVEWECFCERGLATYGPWGSSWTYSSDRDMSCYNRNGVQAASVRQSFDPYTCPELPKVWINVRERALQANESTETN